MVNFEYHTQIGALLIMVKAGDYFELRVCLASPHCRHANFFNMETSYKEVTGDHLIHVEGYLGGTAISDDTSTVYDNNEANAVRFVLSDSIEYFRKMPIHERDLQNVFYFLGMTVCKEYDMEVESKLPLAFAAGKAAKDLPACVREHLGS